MSDCEKDCLDLSFPATDTQASQGIATLSACLTKQGLPEHKADDVKIAVAEAINNVVEHAYAGVSAADVQVNCRLCKEKLDVTISDSGNPMPDFQLPDGVPASVDTARQDLPEGGFGWFLIRQLASDIQYEYRDGRNLLRLRFFFSDSTSPI